MLRTQFEEELDKLHNQFYAMGTEVLAQINKTAVSYTHLTSGNIIALTTNYENGWYQILINGNGLGFAKVVGNTIKNYFPKGLRF